MLTLLRSVFFRGRQRTWIQIIIMSLKDSDQEMFIFVWMDESSETSKCLACDFCQLVFTACQDP